MSSIIGFLERVGRDAQLRQASEDDLLQVLDEMGVGATTSRTVLRADSAMLHAMLQVSPTLCCLIYAPQEEEGDEEGEDDAESGDEGENDPIEPTEKVPRQ